MTIADAPSNPAYSNMIFKVQVTLSGMTAGVTYTGKVGHAASGTDCTTGTWTYSSPQTFSTTTASTRDFYLMNFEDLQSYVYRVEVTDGTTTTVHCKTTGSMRTNLGTATLPANLKKLKLTQDPATGGSFVTKYILLDTDDCAAIAANTRRYLIAWDTTKRKIVWYLDVAAVSAYGGTTTSGWRYQAGATSDQDLFLATVDRRYLYSWKWDGTLLDHLDYTSGCDKATGTPTGTGPCVSHDAFKSDVSGRTYVITAKTSSTDPTGTAWSTCSGTYGTPHLVNDGYQQFAGAYSGSSTSRFLMTSTSVFGTWYSSSTTDDGPDPGGVGCPSTYWSPYYPDPIDWTHANSVAVWPNGTADGLYLSLKEWNQILQITTGTSAVAHRVSADSAYTDYTLTRGSAFGTSTVLDFNDQHDVHSDGTDVGILLFDNEGDSAGSRALHITLDSATYTTGAKATIDKVWRLLDNNDAPQVCTGQGSAELVGTDKVLALCNDFYFVSELVDPTDTASTPAALTLYLDSGLCTSGGPPHGWYRAFPASSIAEFP